MLRGLNCGSGQRPFSAATTSGVGWINIDINPKWNPDIVGNWNDLRECGVEDNTVDYVVSHHSLEHVGCGEGDGFIREAYRVLKPSGSLLVFVPDLRLLAQRWLTGQLDTQLYLTQIYGAYMGHPSDRHAWGYTNSTLKGYLGGFGFSCVVAFDWRPIAGADIARDWYICGMEAIK